MTPEEIEELLGAYALDAVDDDERAAVEEYLATHPRARAEVQQHREVATMLAISGAPAPEGLWDRIAATIEGQAPAPGPELAKVLPLPAPAAPAPAAPAPAAALAPAPAPAGRRRRGGWIAAGGIAAAAAIAIGVLSYGFVQRGDEIRDAQAGVTLERMVARASADPSTRMADLTSNDGSISARALIQPDGQGFLLGQQLPALGPDRTYQLWGVSPGGAKVISLGVLGGEPGITVFSAPTDLSALAITEEEAGGVPVSKQQPALQGALT